jgi:hypothetical protein
MSLYVVLHKVRQFFWNDVFQKEKRIASSSRNLGTPRNDCGMIYTADKRQGCLATQSVAKQPPAP